VKSDHTPLSAAYYEFDGDGLPTVHARREFDGDGLPTVQARRGDYDVNHYYTFEDARAASRGATGKSSRLRVWGCVRGVQVR